MFRWLIVVFLTLMVVNAFTPWFKKLGLGKLPGDFRFSLFGREVFLPVTTTVVLSLVAAGVARFI
jgi:hypothetical protein